MRESFPYPSLVLLGPPNLLSGAVGRGRQKLLIDALVLRQSS